MSAWKEIVPKMPQEHTAYITILRDKEFIETNTGEYLLGPGRVITARVGQHITYKSLYITKVKELPND